jgi:CheY-like chemotaxis protein
MNPAGLMMIEADSMEQVAGQPVLAVIAPEFRDAFAAMHARVISGESMQMEFQVLGLRGGDAGWRPTPFGAALLGKRGHTVMIVENGRECLDVLEQNSFDLVLMDIQMPVMNGEEALRELRRRVQGTTRHQPVIALTAFSLRGEKERFLENGFDGYVSKPLKSMNCSLKCGGF